MKRLLILALVVLILASTVLAASAITSTSDDVLEEKAENLVTNPSFESGYGQEIPGWEITGNLESAYTENGGYTGQRQLSFWNETNSYEVSASQTVAEIPDGTYSLSIWVKSCGTQNDCTISVSEYGGDTRSVEVPQAIQHWAQIRINRIKISSGQCKIQIKSAASSTEWACFDDVVLRLDKNYVQNSSFESGYGQNISDWLITSADNMESAAYAEDGGHNGMRQLSHWSGSSKYQVDTYQNIETLPTGIYTLSAWVKSCGTQKECWMYASGYGGAQRRIRIPQSPQAWTQIQINNIEISNGECKIGFWSDAKAGEWLCVDGVTMTKEANFLKNGSFENAVSADTGNWSISSSNNMAEAVYTEMGGCDGTQQLSFWNEEKPYKVSATQLITGLENGTYTLIAWAKSCGTQNMCWISASDYGGAERRSSVPQSTQEWKSIYIRGIQVTNGKCRVTLHSEAEANEWACFDNLAFVKDDIERPFFKGADMSMLREMEDAGTCFYENGTRIDPFEILKENGFNSIRLKVWNDPGNPNFYPADQSPAEGYNNKAHVVETARKAHNMGFQIVLDFHYSDWWADKHKQFKPHAWEELQFTELKQAVYDYTYDVVNTLLKEGIQPAMVQIGNEINAGILWDDGKIADNASNWNNLAELLKAGCRAVKDVSPEIQTVLHVDDGSDLSMCQDFYANCIENGVDFDVIGLSYYTTWCGSLDQLSETMTALAERYGKPVCVVENSQPWCSGEYTFTGETEKYPCTVLGQKQFLTELLTRIKQVPDGLGIGYFAWEPFWIEPAEKNYQWNNGGFVDFEGNVLDTIHIFRNN